MVVLKTCGGFDTSFINDFFYSSSERFRLRICIYGTYFVCCILVLKIPVAKDAEIVTSKNFWNVQLETNQKNQCYNIRLTLLQVEIQFFLVLGLMM